MYLPSYPRYCVTVHNYTCCGRIQCLPIAHANVIVRNFAYDIIMVSESKRFFFLNLFHLCDGILLAMCDVTVVVTLVESGMLLEYLSCSQSLDELISIVLVAVNMICRPQLHCKGIMKRKPLKTFSCFAMMHS